MRARRVTRIKRNAGLIRKPARHRLRSCGTKGCWGEEIPCERSEVQAECRASGSVALFGRVCDICVERNLHLPAGTPGRMFKGRAVDRGNTAKDQDGKWALLRELASRPSTMAAPKVADFCSLHQGHSGDQADAEMAYAQAAFDGPETWVEFPLDQWPS